MCTLCARLDTERVRKARKTFAPLSYNSERFHQVSENHALSSALANQVLSQLSYRPPQRK